MMRLTRPAAISPASPVRPVPALFETMTSSRAPCSRSAANSASGAPALIPATASARVLTRLSIIGADRSEADRVAALQRQHLPRLGRRGDLERQILETGPDPADLICVALRELPL